MTSHDPQAAAAPGYLFRDRSALRAAAQAEKAKAAKAARVASERTAASRRRARWRAGSRELGLTLVAVAVLVLLWHHQDPIVRTFQVGFVVFSYGAVRFVGWFVLDARLGLVRAS